MVSRRQFLTGATGALLVTVSVGGCGDDAGSSGGFTFSYLRPTWGPATYTKGGPYEAVLERRADVAIDVQIIPVIDYDTKVNTILASGDIPDVIWGSGPVSGTWKEAQDQGAFLPIDEYLSKYPAVRKAVPDNIWDMLKDENGDTYFIPNLIWPQVPFFLFYRQDIFEQANMTEPTTLQEFVDTLEKLKVSYPDKIPFTIGYEWHTKELATSFGVAKQGWEPAPDDPGTLIPWFMKEREIDLYFWLQDLHRRELLDPDYGINKEPNFSTDKLKTDKAIMAVENWAAYPDIVTNLRKVVPDATIGVVSPLGELGGSRQVFPLDRGFYVSAEMEDPDGFFGFLEWTLTKGSTLRRWGIEGKTYEKQDGTNIPIPDVDRDEEYRQPQVEPLGFIGPFDEKLDWEQNELVYQASDLSDRFDYIREKFEGYMAKEYPDYRDPTVLSPTEADKGTQLYEDYIQKVADSAIIDHSVTRDDWMAAVEKWRSEGGNQISDEVNSTQKDKSKPDYTAQ
jgi:putative aldouronate transport system substrate-binding protein